MTQRCIHGNEKDCAICPTLCQASWCRVPKAPGANYCRDHLDEPERCVHGVVLPSICPCCPAGAQIAKPLPEKSLAECFENFSKRMRVSWVGGAANVTASGGFCVVSKGSGTDPDKWIGVSVAREHVEAFLLPFLRGAYGKGVLPHEAEAFQKLTGGKS